MNTKRCRFSTVYLKHLGNFLRLTDRNVIFKYFAVDYTCDNVTLYLCVWIKHCPSNCLFMPGFHKLGHVSCRIITDF